MPNADLITPGLTLCYRCKTRDAVAILTEPGRERYPEALCFECIEDDLERENAAHVSRAGADLIAVAHDELDLALAEPAVRELRRKIDTPAQAQADARCWAVLPDASRCRRRATVGHDPAEPFLCDTHRHGCQVPGLGWTLDGRPCGRIRPANL
jgi:hypothetical protein